MLAFGEMAEITFPYSRKQAAIRGLIRGAGAMMAGASAVIMLYLLGVMARGAFHGEDGKLGWIGWLLSSLVVIILFGLFIQRGYRMYQTITPSLVADFASIVALIFAVAWYHILPPHLPAVVVDYFSRDAALASLVEPGPGPSYRGLLAILAFHIFFKLIKAYLLQVLGFNPSGQNQPPDEPNIPEFPRKSPLVEL